MSIKTSYQVKVDETVLFETDIYNEAIQYMVNHFAKTGVKPEIIKLSEPKITLFELLEDCFTGEPEEAIEAVFFDDEYEMPANHTTEQFNETIQYLLKDAFSESRLYSGIVWLRDGWVTIVPYANKKYGETLLSDIMRVDDSMIYVSPDKSRFYLVMYHQEPVKP